MKCLSLTQPWAALVAAGAKRVETRDWSTAYRGRLAIQATKSWTKDDQALCATEPFRSALHAGGYHTRGDLIRGQGAVVAVVNLIGIVTATETVRAEAEPNELAFGNWHEGRSLWLLRDAFKLPVPVPVRGALTIFELPPGVEAAVSAQMPMAAKGPGAPGQDRVGAAGPGGRDGSDPARLTTPAAPGGGPTRAVNFYDPHDAYIGRAGKGQDGYFGNYAQGLDGPEGFEAAFAVRVERDPVYRERVIGLYGLKLGCPGNCKGRDGTGRCHGDVIAAWLNAWGRERVTREDWEERAAIMEFDGGLAREAAESAATDAEALRRADRAPRRPSL